MKIKDALYTWCWHKKRKKYIFPIKFHYPKGNKRIMTVFEFYIDLSDNLHYESIYSDHGYVLNERGKEALENGNNYYLEIKDPPDVEEWNKTMLTIILGNPYWKLDGRL